MTRYDLTIPVTHIRTADTNTLLRLYDKAQSALDSPLGYEHRQQAERTCRLIARELHKRREPV